MSRQGSKTKTIALLTVRAAVRQSCRCSWRLLLTFTWGAEAAVPEQALSARSHPWASIRSIVRTLAWSAVKIVVVHKHDRLQVSGGRTFGCLKALFGQLLQWYTGSTAVVDNSFYGNWSSTTSNRFEMVSRSCDLNGLVLLQSTRLSNLQGHSIIVIFQALRSHALPVLVLTVLLTVLRHPKVDWQVKELVKQITVPIATFVQTKCSWRFVRLTVQKSQLICLWHGSRWTRASIGGPPSRMLAHTRLRFDHGLFEIHHVHISRREYVFVCVRCNANKWRTRTMASNSLPDLLRSNWTDGIVRSGRLRQVFHEKWNNEIGLPPWVHSLLQTTSDTGKSEDTKTAGWLKHLQLRLYLKTSHKFWNWAFHVVIVMLGPVHQMINVIVHGCPIVCSDWVNDSCRLFWRLAPFAAARTDRVSSSITPTPRRLVRIAVRYRVKSVWYRFLQWLRPIEVHRREQLIHGSSGSLESNRTSDGLAARHSRRCTDGLSWAIFVDSYPTWSRQYSSTALFIIFPKVLASGMMNHILTGLSEQWCGLHL